MWQAIRRVLFWRYQRGSWQYDIIVLVILTFIFFTPATLFDGSWFRSRPAAQSDTLDASSAPLAAKPAPRPEAEKPKPDSDGPPSDNQP